MYTFKIVKAKYVGRNRDFFSVTLLLFAFIGPVIWSPQVEIFFSRNIHNHIAFSLASLFALVFPLILFFIVNDRILGRIYLIGEIQIDEHMLKIQTNNFNREFLLKDINLLKFKGGTGNAKYVEDSKTFVCSILLEDKSVFNIHVTSDIYIDNVRQKKIFGRGIDFLDVLGNYGIKYEFDRKIKESACVV